jgi:hypothetical protein
MGALIAAANADDTDEEEEAEGRLHDADLAAFAFHAGDSYRVRLYKRYKRDIICKSMF